MLSFFESSAGVCPSVDTTTLSYGELSKATGLTTRTLRRYVLEGAINPPAVELVPGSFRVRRVWPADIITKIEAIAARRRQR